MLIELEDIRIILVKVTAILVKMVIELGNVRINLE